MRLAALKDTNSPIDYILNLFSDWRRYGLKTPDDVDGYLFVRDAAQGKCSCILSAEEARRKLEKMREKQRNNNP